MYLPINKAVLFVAYGTGNGAVVMVRDTTRDRGVGILTSVVLFLVLHAVRASVSRWYRAGGSTRTRVEHLLVPLLATIKAGELACAIFCANLFGVTMRAWASAEYLDGWSICFNFVLFVFAGYALLNRLGLFVKPIDDVLA